MSEPQDEREGLPSASALDRIARCPGSLAAERGLPELPKQDVTAEGTAIHQALEDGDDSELSATPKQIAASLKEMEEREIANWKAFYNVPDPVTVTREQRYWVRNRTTLEIVASAKPDIALVSGEYGCVFDYKTGYAKTTASERNQQSRCQVIALWHEHPALKIIRGAILASRLSTTFDACDYTVEDMERIERELRTVLWRAKQPDAQRVPGSHCRYCRALGTCPEAATYALVSSVRAPVLPNGKPDQLAIIYAVGRMTPPELAYVHEREAIAKQVFDSVEARMKALPKDVLESIGYSLAPGNRNHEIVDVPTAFARLSAVLTNEERMACIKVTRGKAAEILADRENISKKAAQEQVDSAIGDAMKEKIGNQKLKSL